MDRMLLHRTLAEQIGVRTETLRNWEPGHREPALRHWPAVIELPGFIPFKVEEWLGERVPASRRILAVPRR